MDRFDAMRAFVRVVEAGSFTKAAETLQMSKTTVTQLVQQLEARLRVRLLNRTTRRTGVTSDGLAYYGRVVKLLADLDDAETVLSSASAAPRGRLRVDVPGPVARLILVPALPAFFARYPDIQLDMGVSDRTVDIIGDNVDCVVRGGEPRLQSMVSRRVADLPIGVYASPGYLEEMGLPDHPAQLSNSHHRMVAFSLERAGQFYPLVMRRGDETVEVQARYALAVDDGTAYQAAGVAGLGILWLPLYMAEPDAAAGRLMALFKDWELDSMPLYVTYPPKRHVSATLRVFIDWIAELMHDTAPVQRRPPR